ncbi:putative metalloprotease CJM1_0395 family protein [Gilvimarinus chinensis]|uniref:putative metalloprotease CJM1_0395 family protein n=1 Tax=Gilvimarinus chinensis TaxID=396005 RepID=UPI00037FA90A|nr:putative metalloprotease CJM1_0395 family protein [Gilvimarinus chinensis]
MAINPLPSNYANAVAPYAPLGRQAVGEESTELKNTVFKSLEEGAATARGENRRSPEDRPAEVEERERTRRGGSRVESDDAQNSEAQQKAMNGQGGQQDKQAAAAQEQSERELVSELAARDREVRAHERAHAAVGGQFAGAPRYEYTRGPDGINYAISGEVSIDTSPVPNNPEATLEKAQQIQRAATAPAEPSAQDRRVAAQATQLAIQAQADIAAEARAERIAEEEAARARRAEREEKESSLVDGKDATGAENKEQAERDRDARAKLFADASARNIDINRRLIDIGVIDPPASGLSLNLRA